MKFEFIINISFKFNFHVVWQVRVKRFDLRDFFTSFDSKQLQISGTKFILGIAFLSLNSTSTLVTY